VYQPRVATTAKPSDSVLAELPARAITFLRAIATRAPIRALLGEGGYGAEDHAEGLALLTRVCDYRDTSSPGTPPSRAQSAMAAIHDWVSTHFPRLRAALERLHPSAAGLFPDTNARHPEASLLALAQVIDRLRRGPESRDSALMATLERRGLVRAELQRLGELVEAAQSAAPSSPYTPDVEPRTDELIALYDWYRDWAETARRLIKRKDYRISLGIAGRGRAGSAEG
jgi:hypothetical protein